MVHEDSQSAENEAKRSTIAGTSISTLSNHGLGNVKGRGREEQKSWGWGRKAVRYRLVNMVWPWHT